MFITVSQNYEKENYGNDVIAGKTEELNKDDKTVRYLVFALKNLAVDRNHLMGSQLKWLKKLTRLKKAELL